MARIIQTVGAGASSGAGLTESEVLALIQANVGYEYIRTITLTSTEVSGIEITGLDTSTYSAFRIVSSRLSYGGSASNVTWTIRILTGTNTTDSNGFYEQQGLKFAPYTQINQSSMTGWSTTFGYGGHPACADFEMDYQISPNTTNSTVDANMRITIGSSKQGGYWPAAGILTGIHLPNAGAPSPTGIIIQSNMNFRSMDNSKAYITVMGLRIRS